MEHRNPTVDCGEQGLCNEVPLDCDPCCRCIPNEFCAVLDRGPYEDPVVTRLIRDELEYLGIMECEGERIQITVTLLQREDEKCYWHVLIISEDDPYDPIVDDDYIIGEYPDFADCEDPHFSYGSPFLYCDGQLKIDRYELARLPYIKRGDCYVPYCGACECVCKTLCVTRMEYGHIDPMVEMDWDPDSKQWGRWHQCCSFDAQRVNQLNLVAPTYQPPGRFSDPFEQNEK